MTKKKTPELQLVPDREVQGQAFEAGMSSQTALLGPPDPFSVPVRGVWLQNAQGFAAGSSSVLVGNQFATQLGSSGVVKALDLNPETGAVRVTMGRQSGDLFRAFLGAACVLLSDAGQVPQ